VLPGVSDAKAHTVALDPIGLNSCVGVLLSMGTFRQFRLFGDSAVRTLSPVRTVDVEYTNCATVAHPLLSNAHNPSSICIECDALHRSRELPREQAFARADRPEAHLVVRGARHDVFCFD
jgi:hypothetical protein